MTQANPKNYKKGDSKPKTGSFVRFNNGAVARVLANGQFRIVQGADRAALARARKAPRNRKRRSGVASAASAKKLLKKRYSDLLKSRKHKTTRAATYDLRHPLKGNRVLNLGDRKTWRWRRDPHLWDIKGVDDGSLSKKEIQELVKSIVRSSRRGPNKRDTPLRKKKRSTRKKRTTKRRPRGHAAAKKPAKKRKTATKKRRKTAKGGGQEYFGNWF